MPIRNDSFFERNRDSYKDMFFTGVAHESWSASLVAVFGKGGQTANPVISLDLREIASLFPEGSPDERKSNALKEIFDVASDKTRREIYKAAGALQQAQEIVRGSKVAAAALFPTRKEAEDRVVRNWRDLGQPGRATGMKIP